MVERVAAVVGDALVLASEVEDRVGPLMADVNRITDPDKRSARATALRREVLERLIDDELIYQQAAELKLTISSEQVDASIEEIKKQNNLTDEQLREALRGQGMTMASTAPTSSASCCASGCSTSRSARVSTSRTTRCAPITSAT